MAKAKRRVAARMAEFEEDGESPETALTSVKMELLRGRPSYDDILSHKASGWEKI